MSEKRIIAVDSQILNSIQSCAKRTEYKFVHHIDPLEKSEALEKGSLMHHMMEMYYGVRFGRVNPKSDTWLAVAKDTNVDPLEVGLKYKNDREGLVDYIAETAPLFTFKMELDQDDAAANIYQFREYHKYYGSDNWNVLAVEEVASKVLYEDDEFKMIYNGKMDLVAEQGSMIAPWDHKTSSRRQDPTSMNNQFLGYAWLLGVNRVVVNTIGFQKTLKPNERFQRVILMISKDRIAEWVRNTTWWMFQLLNHVEQDVWPMNLTSCDKFSGCDYRPICLADDINRDDVINRKFKKGEKWDVSTILTAPTSTAL